MVEVGSKKLIARVGRGARSGDEESRAFLQERLVVLSRLLFWSFVVLLGGMVMLYREYPLVEPKRNHTIYVIALVGLVMLGAIWRGALARRKLAINYLHAIDLYYGLGTGAIFASAAYLASDLRLAVTANILWSCFMIFLRTIVVPSTGMRTAVVATVTFAPMLFAAIGLAVETDQGLPAPAFIGGFVIISIVVILLATIGSRLIFGLRRQVSAAIRLGQYTLDAMIGQGGNGEVYRAHHALLRRPTAIKLVRPDRMDALTLDRFEREVQHMSQLTHPNTVAVFDYGRNPEGVFYYAMEYLDGIDLEKLVIQYGPQPADRVVAILVQVCGALQEAHRRALIHRDIKPANIILCERGDIPDVAKVVDFGLVKHIAAEHRDTTRGILGTPAYIAPEVVTDPDHVGPSADLYSLGAVGYFLLTGRRVFEGKTAVDVCVKHVSAVPVPPSQLGTMHVPEALETILMSCLAKRPADRPVDAAALAASLQRLANGNTWVTDDAVRWWSEFRSGDHAAQSIPTITITVELGGRDRVDATLR